MVKRMRTSRGFTLTELMVVVSIIGLSLLITAPMVGQYMRDKELSDSTRALASHLDLARNLAIADHNPCEVFFDSGAGTYWLLDDDNGNGTADTGERQFGPYSIGSTVSIQNLDLGGGGRLVFQPSGMLASTQGGRVIFGDARGNADTLEVYNSGTTSKHIY